MKAPAAVLLALAASGCATLLRGASIEVREVGRSLYCNTPGETAQALLLSGAEAVIDWQTTRGVVLAGPESLSNATYAVVENGLRPTGGYSLAVSRSALLRGEKVVLQATFFSPAPGSLRTQALSSPCVLVQLPAGRYAAVEVRDPAGNTVADSSRPALPETPVEAPTEAPAVSPPPAAEPEAPAAVEPAAGEPAQ